MFYFDFSFVNIDSMYDTYRQHLLEDDTYRPCKSVTRDVESTVNKFTSYYQSNNKTILEENDILAICDADKVNDTTNTNVRVMREFGFIEVLGAGRYQITSKFISYVNGCGNPGAFILDMMYKIRGKDDLIMYSNLILCTLREGYKYGKIIAFPDSDKAFKSTVQDAGLRYEYRKRVFDVYGFSGRNLTPEDDSYTPNANYRVLTTLKNLNLIENGLAENGLNTFKLTSNAIHLLQTIDANIEKNSSSYSNDEDSVFAHNIYGLHIKLQNDALSETNPHICIGWSGMGDLSSVSSKEELGVKYDATWPGEKVRKKGQDIGQVWRFIKEMQIGDYVVFSNGDTCHIGHITSNYRFDDTPNPNQDPDYANFRDVEWLKTNIPKSDLSEAFQNSLGAAMSVWTLNDYKSAVYDLLKGTYKKDDVLLEEIEEEDIFSGFKPWLTSYDNPDYTGRQSYDRYSDALRRLIDFMYKEGLIEDNDLNEKRVEKYNSWMEIYNSSNESKDFDKKASKAGIAALKKYVNYIKYLITPHVVNFDYSITKNTSINKIFYGVPGCGKSYHIQHKILQTTPYIRTTFYQDYSNTDFVGQILPKVVKGENGEKDTVEYIFNPGPFTLALIQAISNPGKKIALVIEEINRGNAPAIFGDIFQLLDRDEFSISEYGIKNVGMIDYLNAYEFLIDGEKKRYHFDEIKIPGNLDIYATMNTSDQNVYTLDTAFTRRWTKEHIPNEFNGHKIEKMYVPGMASYTWGEFVTAVNRQIRDNLESLQVNEDKQVGAFFVKERDLLEKSDDSTEQKAKMFAYKVLEYLWADVSKLDHHIIFNPKYTTFEAVVKDFANGIIVFNDKLGFKVASVAPITEE